MAPQLPQAAAQDIMPPEACSLAVKDDRLGQAYLRHLLLPAVKAPLTLVQLKAIYKAHITRFGFNSYHIMLGESLELRGLQGLNSLARRGGVCLEHAEAMKDCLRALGFDARVVAGEVSAAVHSNDSTREREQSLT